MNGEKFEVIEGEYENEEAKDNEDVNDETDEKLNAPYDEIAAYFSEWELPEEGILPEGS